MAKNKAKKGCASLTSKPIETVRVPEPDSGRATLIVTSKDAESARTNEKAEATTSLASMKVLPTPSNADGEGGHRTPDIHSDRAPLPIDDLRTLQAHRVATIRTIGRINNATRAIVRSALGFQVGMTDKERAKINRQAEKMVTAIQKGLDIDDTHVTVAEAVTPFCLKDAAAVLPQVEFCKGLEKQMRKMARALPVWPWVEAQRGLGDLGLAIIVGEVGDLSKYGNPGKLWKRMGLSVFRGKAPSTLRSRPCKEDDMKADDWVALGYSPRRRSAIFTLGDALVKQGAEYREVYLTRKAYELDRAPDMTPMHAHRRAQRYMEKRMLRDLWREWKAADGGHSRVDNHIANAPAAADMGEAAG